MATVIDVQDMVPLSAPYDVLWPGHYKDIHTHIYKIIIPTNRPTSFINLTRETKDQIGGDNPVIIVVDGLGPM